MTFRPDLMGRAALTRMENLGGPPYSWDDASRTMRDYGARLTKPQLCDVAAYLAARVLAAETKDGAA